MIAERPAAFHVDVPESGLRLRYYPDGPAAEFRDGTSIFVGTVAWIETHREPEECWAAIEHLGWEAFIAEAHAKHIASAPDPGNPGAQLHLYQLPQEDLRILVVTNGSQERDGTRRCYGLPVPHFIDPVAAAAWTYGLDRHRYAQLVRRT